MPTKSPVKKNQEKQKSSKWIWITKANDLLGIIFYLIWIMVGLFFLLYTTAAIRQGALEGLFGSRSTTQPAQTESPTETTIPGIGKVNIQCVQDNLSTETIQKIVQAGNTSTLTDEEKSKFEPCIIEKEQSQ